MRKRNNAGFTLIELIVVIAIMGVLVGMSSTGISLMFRKDADKTAVDIEGGLDKLRTYTMSKSGSWYMRIESDSSGSKWTIYRDEGSGETVYEEQDLGNKTTISPAQIDVKYNRVTGGVSSVRIAPAGWTPALDITTITVDSNRTSKSKTVNIVKLTGRHFVE